MLWHLSKKGNHCWVIEIELSRPPNPKLDAIMHVYSVHPRIKLRQQPLDGIPEFSEIRCAYVCDNDLNTWLLPMRDQLTFPPSSWGRCSPIVIVNLQSCIFDFWSLSGTYFLLILMWEESNVWLSWESDHCRNMNAVMRVKLKWQKRLPFCQCSAVC